MEKTRENLGNSRENQWNLQTSWNIFDGILSMIFPSLGHVFKKIMDKSWKSAEKPKEHHGTSLGTIMEPPPPSPHPSHIPWPAEMGNGWRCVCHGFFSVGIDYECWILYTIYDKLWQILW